MTISKDTADSMETPVETPENTIDTRLVRKLAGILKDTGLSEIEIEKGDLRIRVARELMAAPNPYGRSPRRLRPPACRPRRHRRYAGLGGSRRIASAHRRSGEIPYGRHRLYAGSTRPAPVC